MLGHGNYPMIDEFDSLEWFFLTLKGKFVKKKNFEG